MSPPPIVDFSKIRSPFKSAVHEIPHPLFVPFGYLYEKCQWKSWINNKYPKTYDSIGGWFQNLTSLFTKRMLKKQVLAEGFVLIHPNGRMVKLRRNMFDWHQGPATNNNSTQNFKE